MERKRESRNGKKGKEERKKKKMQRSRESRERKRCVELQPPSHQQEESKTLILDMSKRRIIVNRENQ